MKHLSQRSYIFKTQGTATNDKKRGTNHPEDGIMPVVCLQISDTCLGPTSHPEDNDTPLYPWTPRSSLDQGHIETQRQWWLPNFCIGSIEEAILLGEVGTWICICMTLNKMRKSQLPKLKIQALMESMQKVSPPHTYPLLWHHLENLSMECSPRNLALLWYFLGPDPPSRTFPRCFSIFR